MMPSNEERLILTGMLGDVMRESAQAALSYVARTPKLGIDPEVFAGKVVHSTSRPERCRKTAHRPGSR